MGSRIMVSGQNKMSGLGGKKRIMSPLRLESWLQARAARSLGPAGVAGAVAAAAKDELFKPDGPTRGHVVS